MENYEFKWNRECRHLLCLYRGISPDRYQGGILSFGEVLAVISGSRSGRAGGKYDSKKYISVPGFRYSRLFMFLEHQGTFRAAEAGGTRMVSRESEKETVERDLRGCSWGIILKWKSDPDSAERKSIRYLRMRFFFKNT